MTSSNMMFHNGGLSDARPLLAAFVHRHGIRQPQQMWGQRVSTNDLHHGQCTGRPHSLMQDMPSLGVLHGPEGVGQVDAELRHEIMGVCTSSWHNHLRCEPLGLQQLGVVLEDGP